MAHGEHAHHHHGHGHSHRPGRSHDHGHEHDHSHGHARGHDHSHNHLDASDASNGARLGIAALLTGAFMVVEVGGGIISGSLALIADAGHMLSDFASLVLAFVGFRIARRPADETRTYGFRRFTVLAAFVNGIALVAVAGWIVFEAAMRLLDPHAVEAAPMMAVAAAGLAVNIIVFLILHGADRENLNVRGAIAHVIGDLLGSVAAILAAVIIMWTGWTPADPILSILVALLILRSAVSLTKDAGHILLEGAPRHIDVAHVSKDLAEHIDEVVNIHHAHAWSIDEKRPMMTLHARIKDGARPAPVIAAIKHRLHEVHGVGHVTVEIETEDACADDDCD